MKDSYGFLWALHKTPIEIHWQSIKNLYKSIWINANINYF